MTDMSDCLMVEVFLEDLLQQRKEKKERGTSKSKRMSMKFPPRSDIFKVGVDLSHKTQLQGFQEKNSPAHSYHISISAEILVAMEMIVGDNAFTHSCLLETRRCASLLTQKNIDKFESQKNPPTPKTDFCSTTQKDFCVEGFVSLKPEPTQLQYA
ncbi:hypothetical protein INR49_023408, partial [Caranx melampygus]